MRRRSRGWGLVGLMCANGAAVAQAPVERASPLPVVTRPVELGQVPTTKPEVWPQVGLNVTVMDRIDEPATGISFSQLVVTDNGKPVTAGTLLADSEPESVCLLVDSSGSTYSSRKAITTELLELIHDLPAEDELCAIDFSSEAYRDVPLSMDRAPLTKWTSFLRSAGGTALRDAVRATATYLEKEGKFRSRAIVLISDGGENVSHSTEEELLKSLRAPGAPAIYALVNSAYPGSEQPGDQKRLSMLTSETGGLEFPIKHEGDQRAAVARLVRAMAGRYRLVYTAPDPDLDGSTHLIEVGLNKELRKQKMNIVAPRGYDAVGR